MKSNLLSFLAITISLQLFCTSPESQTTDKFDRDLVTEQVREAVWAFHAADTSRDANAIIDLLWPDCTLLIDGNPVTYQDVSSGSIEFMSAVDQFHTDWTNLNIIPLSEYVAISSFSFRDSIVHKSGTISQAKGPNTFVWQKRDDQWRVIHTDADHYPIE